MAWFSRARPEQVDRPGPPLLHALDGFLSAGASAQLATSTIRSADADIVHEFDLDAVYDYRARRPPIVFRSDHYADYEEPRLLITREHDVTGREFLLLAGPEPDFGWESFVAETIGIIADERVSLTVGLGAIPMGVPHTRPAPITAHGSRPELVDAHLRWDAEVTVPSSAQALLEYRLAQAGMDSVGYIVHVPHYLAQFEYPTAALALLDAVGLRLGLTFDVEELKAMAPQTLERIAEQISEQGGEEVLAGLEQQYDAFTRGAAQSLLDDDAKLPSGDELAAQLERYLARHRDDENPGGDH